jgi:hypothetical protein
MPVRPCASAEDALAFVEAHGVVLVSAKGSAPRLVEAIAGQPIQGSWWAHPEGKRIFAVLSAVTGSEQVLVCRLIDGKLTLVHGRLWPSLARLAHRLAPAQLARVREEHTPSGRHASHEIPFPTWVPEAVMQEAGTLSEQEALAKFAAWLAPIDPPVKKARRSARAR